MNRMQLDSMLEKIISMTEEQIERAAAKGMYDTDLIEAACVALSIAYERVRASEQAH